MSYGWATVFTLAAWFAGLVIDANVRVGDLGLRTVLPVIVMGCCVMKYIKDNGAMEKSCDPEWKKSAAGFVFATSGLTTIPWCS